MQSEKSLSSKMSKAMDKDYYDAGINKVTLGHAEKDR